LGGFSFGVVMVLLIFMFTHHVPPPPPPTPEQIEEQKKDAWVRQKIASMSAQEKVGQMLMWHINETELSSASATMLANIPFGGVIIMGNHTKDGLKKLIDQINAIPALVPRFIAVDQEGGLVKRLIDDPNPGEAALSGVSPAEFCGTYKKTTELLAYAGVTMNFGIVADIGWFPDGFISPRTFGRNAGIVADLVGQAAPCSAGLISAVKHFPGHGRTKLDSHTTVPVIKTPYDEWKTTDALPFQKAIDNNIPVIMLGHLIYEKIASEPASLSPFWIQKLRDMGHKGLIITDDLGMLEKSGMKIEEVIEKAFNAGADMLLFVTSSEKPDMILDGVRKKTEDQKTEKEEIDRKVKKILQYKYSLRQE
jgi:beta-N-acetylhexosaminidase